MQLRSLRVQLTTLVAGLLLSYGALAQNKPHPATVPVGQARSNLAGLNAAGSCPNYSGPLDSIGVPVGQSASFVVLSGPAPEEGYTWGVYSADPSIVAAGNATQGFVPVVTTAPGETTSTPFTLYGVGVGQTTLILEALSGNAEGNETPMTAWAVNPGNDSSFVDANFPYNSCRVDGGSSISGDPSVLANCGGNVEGTVSDGVSQLLLRVQSGLQGTACFSITSSSDLDQGSISTGVTSTQSVGAYDYGFSFYQAPATYGDASESRQVQVQFSFAPSIGNANTTSFTAPLTVIRPPSVLIHGLWSNSGAWSTVWDRSGFLEVNSRADYHATNASNFSVNAPMVKAFVADGLQKVRDLGYAATQADVVAHSMGGLLTRLYAGSSAYQRPDNFGLGDVRRLVTLDTPHSGASTANLIVSLNANSLVFRALGDLLSGIRGVGFSTPIFNQGAVCDLAENSPALQSLADGTNLSSQVITATGGPPGTASGGPYWLPLELALTAQACFINSPVPVGCAYIFPQDVVDDFRFRQQNDAIVPLSSEQGGIGGINFPTYIHTSVTGGADVANQTFTLLDGPSSAFVNALPGVGSNGLGNPLTVPGRGTALDQSDYASQCTVAGAPLNPGSTSLALIQQRTGTTNLVSKGKAVPSARSNAETTDARLVIASPANGQVFTPGSSITVTVQVASSLRLEGGSVASDIPGIAPATGTGYTGTSYLAQLTIPATFAGSVTLTPAALDTSGNPVRGVATTISVVPAAPPTSLTVLSGTYHHFTALGSTGSIHVLGNYAQQTSFDLTSSATGTTYYSSNPQVLTVDSEGNVQALGYGTAVVTVQNGALKAFAAYDVESTTTALPPQNLTTQVTVHLSGFQLNRNTGFYAQTATLTNTQAIPLVGPLYLVVSALSGGVTLTSSGSTKAIQPAGSSYVRLQLPDGFTLAPGASVALNLQFLNPSQTRIGYSANIFRTLTNP